MKFTKDILIMAACVGTLSACSLAPTIGARPADIPPQIINNPDDPSVRIWDKPSAFGPVPSQLAAKGQATCASLNTKETQYQAIGYHPKAKNFEGQTMTEGGYLCYPK